MKSVPRTQKMYCLIISVAVLMSQVPNVLASALSESTGVRLSVQRYYAIRVGQKIQNILCTLSSEADLDSFVKRLLRNGADPFIHYPVDYVPHKRLTLTLQTTDFVEKQLQGKTIVYSYSPEATQWRFNPNESTLATATNPTLPDFGMAVITEYCQKPQIWKGWKFKPDFLFEQEWCCPWLEMVMPPFSGKLPPYCSDDKTGAVRKKPDYLKDLGRCYPLPSFETKKLHIPRIAVSQEGQITIFQATLCESHEGFFSLCEHKVLPDTTRRADDPTYTDHTKLITIPTVQVGTEHYTYQLKLKHSEGDMLFEVIEKTELPQLSSHSLSTLSTESQLDLQKYYASLVWNELKMVIENSANTEQSALKEEVEEYAKNMLQDDPLIKEVRYVYEPQVSLQIIMHNNDFFNFELPKKISSDKGDDEELKIESLEMTGKVSCDSLVIEIDSDSDSLEIHIEESDSCGDIKETATPPEPLIVDVAMCLITEYCNDPQDYTHFGEGMLSDIEWCPSWLHMVMPSHEHYTPCSY